jgi:integrase
MAGAGARTLRHSWAIRALANESPIKSIADVLGHRYIDTTFIYGHTICCSYWSPMVDVCE